MDFMDFMGRGSTDTLHHVMADGVSAVFGCPGWTDTAVGFYAGDKCAKACIEFCSSELQGKVR